MSASGFCCYTGLLAILEPGMPASGLLQKSIRAAFCISDASDQSTASLCCTKANVEAFPL